MKRKRYRVDSGLVPHLRRVLTRSFYSHRFTKDKDGVVWCEVAISSDAFHKAVLRARCEKEEAEHPGQHYITSRESRDWHFLSCLFNNSLPEGAVIIDSQYFPE